MALERRAEKAANWGIFNRRYREFSTVVDSYAHARDEQFAAWNRRASIGYRPWVWTDKSSKTRVVYDFFPDGYGDGTNCRVQINSGAKLPAQFALTGNKVVVTSSAPKAGTHTYTLSADEQTLAEIGGDGRTFMKAP